MGMMRPLKFLHATRNRRNQSSHLVFLYKLKKALVTYANFCQELILLTKSWWCFHSTLSNQNTPKYFALFMQGFGIFCNFFQELNLSTKSDYIFKVACQTKEPQNTTQIPKERKKRRHSQGRHSLLKSNTTHRVKNSNLILLKLYWRVQSRYGCARYLSFSKTVQFTRMSKNKIVLEACPIQPSLPQAP